ncbi:hypothetical protein [Mycobacterium sp.]|uniref:hypothetical protein n=1 Tax=Mycobacterium sp. TaxID=1785 RepID=UPI003D11AAE9
MTEVVGTGPLAYTDQHGLQRVIPLAAFVFDSKTIQIRSTWTSALSSADRDLITLLAAERVKAGEFAQAPTPAPVPAVRFTAAEQGSESNNIVVTVDYSANTGLDTALTITAERTDTYPGLTDANAAAAAIGKDATKADFLFVDSTTVSVQAKLPDEFSDKDLGTDYNVTTGGAVHFTLKPHPGLPANSSVKLSLTHDSSGSTFTVTVKYSSNPTPNPGATIPSLSPLDPGVTYLVTATAPAGGAAVPAKGSIQLTGGGPGHAASGLAYTS